MSEIRVFPGVSIETEGGQLALKFIRMIGESQEAYVERLQQVTNLALSFVPKSEPATFDFSDTSKYRQVGPTAWEAITPGYQSEDVPKSERDSHFAVFAELLWNDLHTLFARKGDEKQYEAMDEEIIAQRAYDLVFQHALVYLREGADIPDMTAWPEQSE